MRKINKNFAQKKSGSQAQAISSIATVECWNHAGREVNKHQKWYLKLAE